MPRQRMRVYSTSVEPVQQYVVFTNRVDALDPLDPDSGAIGSCYTPTAFTLLPIPLGGSLEVRLPEVYYADSGVQNATALVNRTCFTIKGYEADAWSGGFPGKYQGTSYTSLNRCTSVGQGEFQTANYMPGDVVTFTKTSFVYGYTNSVNGSPEYSSFAVNFAINGGTVDAETVFCQAVSQPILTGTVDLSLSINDYVPTRPGYVFTHWLCESDHRGLAGGGEDPDAVGTTYTIGDTIISHGHRASSASIRVMCLIAQWEAV